MQKKVVFSIISGVLALIVGLIQKYFEVNNMITAQNSYLLLLGVAILGGICVSLLIWAFWSTVNQRFKRVRQLFSNIPRLSIEDRALLDFYERQKINWQSYIRLKLVKVAPHTKAASPYLILTLEVHNYLPINFRLVRVSDTEGTVGQCNLPPLPENIDKKINACTEDQFEIKVGVHGTKIPEFLQSQEALGKPHLLQWYLKGVWYADIYGKIQPIKYKADNLWCESLLSIME